LGEDATIPVETTSDDIIIVAAEDDRWRTSRRTLGTTTSSFDFVAEAHVNGSSGRLITETVGAKDTTTGARSMDIIATTCMPDDDGMERFIAYDKIYVS
jgi:hypothetical protein